MLLEMCKSKIHRARLTHCDLDYEGSLEIDIAYLEKANMLPYEKITRFPENAVPECSA